MADKYPQIDDYGLIGDMRSAALVSNRGSIDFFCYPNFDSPSVFTALLDGDKGGHFQLQPRNPCIRSIQQYIPESNILITRFLSTDGIVEVTDWMPTDDTFQTPMILRSVQSIRGCLDIELWCQPILNYAQTPPDIFITEEGHRAEFKGSITDQDPPLALTVVSKVSNNSESPALQLDLDHNALHHVFPLAEGDRICYAFGDPAMHSHLSTGDDFAAQMGDTLKFWRDWVNRIQFGGRWQKEVTRSALTLKLLHARQYGSLLAAPTFGLPEMIGGDRNWDYRYCWIRDSAFTVYAFTRLELYEEARHYIHWVYQRFEGCGLDGTLKLMYRVNGDFLDGETTLPHLQGYKGSRPVRIGNQAAEQLQLDIYGELLDAVYLSVKYYEKQPYHLWEILVNSANYVCEHWHKPDAGIWEFRGAMQQFTHTKLMCWVAVDRAIRMAQNQSLPAPRQRWLSVRDEITYYILNDCWNEERQAFVQHPESQAMDASLLMMPLLKFIGYRDPKWLSTLACIEQDLVTDALVMRYRIEDLAAGMDTLDARTEGTFTMCSFWYVECLARGGQVDKARLLFDKLLTYANPLGLYSEELGFDGSHLGNFPQAFTHLALISTAHALSRALSELH